MKLDIIPTKLLVSIIVVIIVVSGNFLASYAQSVPPLAPGVTYFRARDLNSFQGSLALQNNGYYQLRFGRQYVWIKPKSTKAILQGAFPKTTITLKAIPFIWDGDLYVPGHVLRLLGCSLDARADDAVIKLSCISGIDGDSAISAQIINFQTYFGGYTIRPRPASNTIYAKFPTRPDPNDFNGSSNSTYSSPEADPSTYSSPTGCVSSCTVYVHGYYRSNGTYVHSYTRSSPKR